MSRNAPRMLWEPDPSRITEIGRFMTWLRSHGELTDSIDYEQLWEWSIADPNRFWTHLWHFFGVRADGTPAPALADATMPGARWFPNVGLNYAEHALTHDQPDTTLAIIAHGQRGPSRRLTYGDLRNQVARAQEGLRRLGVGRGDRVGGYLSNTPETVIAFLATAGLGAVWSVCAPEFGTGAVLDRLSQIEPKVLIAVDGYVYGGAVIDRRDELAAIRAGLPSVTTMVRLPSLFGDEPDLENTMSWAEFVAHPGLLNFDRVPFDHPLYVLFSSGTTGSPKPIVHGHGGMLLTHLKDGALQLNVRPTDRFFWFTTTGWMMWNTVVSTLLTGATIVLFDGNPSHPDLSALWRLVASDRITHFGASAAYLTACRKAGIQPGDSGDLSALRFIGSTGSPLPVTAYDWVSEQLGPHVQLGSVSGGTDVCSLLVGSSPLSPVWSGEISCRTLGVPVDSFDADGRPVREAEGELVVTGPIPGMPVALYGDTDGSRYRATWFDTFPGIWRQGDWITITDRGSAVISGRSDATLNRGGVRIGTAEFYSTLEQLPEIADSLVVHLEDSDTGHGELVTFIVPTDPDDSTVDLHQLVRDTVRSALSPRHVPDRIISAPVIPRTLTGKKLEIPVKKILQGAAPKSVASPDSLADPHSLEFFGRLRDSAGIQGAGIQG
ncbi:acetoacetate--CoA ligase [Nocardia sp. NPDC059246]|uniref:acetoacetate--CoA ligase n=1 Tax=unclassified Nocardia TaxID=2637762 RepID=UPI0036947B47